MTTPFQDWVRQEIAAEGGNMSAVARRWGVPTTYVFRWRGDDDDEGTLMNLPAYGRLPELAARSLSQTPLDILQQLWVDSARQRGLVRLERRLNRMRRRAGVASVAALPDNARFHRGRLFARSPRPALSPA